jgi:endonuclease YncB( thermonuclease family)
MGTGTSDSFKNRLVNLTPAPRESPSLSVPQGIAPSPTGRLPAYQSESIAEIVGQARIQEQERREFEEEDQEMEAMLGMSNDLASQCDSQSQTCMSDTPRGVPRSSTESSNLRGSIRDKGEARLRALTELFGRDALVLGHLLFEVPPLAIRIKKGNITYRWKPLRTKESIAIKSGNGECYIEIDLVFVGKSQIQDSLSELIALFKKVPFCFIENTHIRKMMIPNNPDESMAVCLQTMVIDAISGRPNTVYVTLITKWFNYKPYSQNFWFRKEWKPSENFGAHRSQSGNQRPSAGGEGNRASEGGTESPPADPNRTILVDLSAIQDPEVLSYMARDLPPEVGLLEANQINNPGDPTIDGTYPVVYPFNSQPFLDRVRTGNDAPVRIRNWSDGVGMQWNSFIRMNVPRSWQYTVAQEPRVSVAISRPRDRSAERSTSPLPVTGERDTILFLGDSIMVGFTAQTDQSTKSPTEGGPEYSVPTFYEWTGNTQFSATREFRYISMMREEVTSGAVLNWWNLKKDDSSLKADNNENPCSRVAGVLIHLGTYDTNGSQQIPDFEALRTIITEASEFGAIPMICRLPPSNDASHLTPPKLSQLRLWWDDTTFESYQNSLADYNRQLKSLAEGNNGIFIDYHPAMVESRFRNSPSPPLASDYQASVAGNPTYYSFYWNTDGYIAGGNYIHGSMPWNSLSGVSPPAEPNSTLWTVCYVEDGDTLWAWGNDPNSGQRVVRNVRMQYIDTPETYGEFSDSRYNAGGESPMPEGQDSYRPSNAKYGTIAKNYLRDLLPEGTQVSIDWGGTGAYGRHLGVVYKGADNINRLMVEQGHAFAILPSNPSNEMNEQEVGFEYWRAELTAKGQWPRNNPSNGSRGIWNQREVSLTGVPAGFSSEVRANLVRVMRPSDYRTVYAPASDGGHGGQPSVCNEEPSR